MGACCCAGLVTPSRGRIQRSTSKVKHKFLLINSADCAPEDRYIIREDAVGEGGFGTVRGACYRETGRRCVIKTMVKADIDDLERFVQEIELQASLDHPNILRVHETFENRTHIHLVLSECTGGEVLDLLDLHGNLDERQTWLVTKQVLCALRYMHDKHIVHRDLKLDNLLLKYENVTLEKNIVKLIDFGMAIYHGPESDSLRTICGTPFYMAPEILSERYSEKCDSWSCGVMVYMLLCGFPPFDGETPQEILNAVKTSELSFDDSAWSGVKETAKRFVAQMCNRNVAKRLSMAQALSTKWIQDSSFTDAASVGASTLDKTNAVDNLRRFTRKNPLERLIWTCIARKIEDSHIEALQKLFLELDTRGSGELSLKELRAGCAQAGLNYMNESFEDMRDNSEDVKIKYSDFLAANLSADGHFQDTAGWEAFRLLDANGDGEISARELHQALARQLSNGFDMTEEEVESLIADADADGSQSLSFDEVRNLISPRKKPQGERSA